MESGSAVPAVQTSASRYPWYVVTVLGAASALAYMDRQIIGLLLEPIKADLKLTDFQVSLLLGLAYVMFYAIMGLPLAYLADRFPRGKICGIGVLLWSIATAACGLASTFWQLFAGRLGLGIGQAALSPTASSLLPDYFEPQQLPRAFSIYQIGTSLGVGGAYVIGGFLLAIVGTWHPINLPFTGLLKPWQIVLLLAAAPGPVIAVLMLTVREPQRRKNTLLRGEEAAVTGFGGFLASRAFFLAGLYASILCMGMIGYGVISWTPSFFIRSFGWTAAKVGEVYGCVIIVGSFIGMYSGGVIASAWSRRNVAAPALVLLWTTALTIPCAIVYPLCGDPRWALLTVGTYNVFLGAAATMSPSLLQLATPHSFRARAAALYYIAAAFSVALGPMAIAAVTDFVFHDNHRLNQSIAIVSAITGPVALVATFIAYREFVRFTAEKPQPVSPETAAAASSAS